MKRLCYMIIVLALLMFVVSCDDAVKNTAQIMESDITKILDGSHEVNGIATQVTKDTIVIEGINIKDALLAADPQGEWKSVITDDTVGFVFVPSKDIPASSTGFPKKDLVAGQEYPIEVTIDEDTGMSVAGSDIVGDELNTKENETNGSGSGTDGSGSGTDGSGSGIDGSGSGTDGSGSGIDGSGSGTDGSGSGTDGSGSGTDGSGSGTDGSGSGTDGSGSGSAKKKTVIIATPQSLSELKSLIAERIRRDGNQADLNDIDVRNITDMTFLFKNSSFNGDISEWNVSNVTTMRGMFYNSKFNQDISNWNMSNVTNTTVMFRVSKFNQDISKWDMSNVITMGNMFSISPFNQDISGWDMSSVTNMEYMFKDSQFNQDISGWDVRNVTNMSKMFMNAKKITYNLEAWGSKLRSGVNKTDVWAGSSVEAAGNKPSWA